MPGLNWTASEQCQFYTQRTDVDQYTPRDKTDDDMCQALWCKGAGSDYYSAGPALEGTRFELCWVSEGLLCTDEIFQVWKPKVLL